MEKTAMVNGQEVVNVSVSDMEFLSIKTKNILHKAGVMDLCGFTETFGYTYADIIAGLVKKGLPHGSVICDELAHIPYYAIWERSDGKPFVPRSDYRKSLIGHITYCFGFLWKDCFDSDIMWRSGEFPKVNPIYGIKESDLYEILDSVSDEKAISFGKAFRAFFEHPVIRAAYKMHVLEAVMWICGSDASITFGRNSRKYRGFDTFSYEFLRDITVAWYDGKRKVIMGILNELEDEGWIVRADEYVLRGKTRTTFKATDALSRKAEREAVSEQ